tara:strand:+ start:210 stop:332 length:123 start_codon:yes stop_codon:yes gene_type:complete
MRKHLSKHQRQWAWFVLLWCGGLGSVMLLGYVIRLAMGID